MKTVDGDLIDMALSKKVDVIVHGCNCFNSFGRGIALKIAKAFPLSEHCDSLTRRGDRTKLGSILYVEDRGVIVVNAYTQYRYGRDRQHTDYDAVESCFRLIAQEFPNKRIGYPAIGAGLGGGDWGVISEIIDTELSGLDHTFVVYKEKEPRGNKKQ